jgi:hypothetical protein
MAFASEMRDGFRIYAVDALNLSSDESEEFADMCASIDNQNQTYDLVAAKSTAGGHSLPTVRQRIDAALREGTRRVRQRQSVDLANSKSSRGAFGLPVGVGEPQRLPAPGLRVINRGEGGGSVPPVPNNATGAFYNSPGAPGVTSLPNNDIARYVRPGTNDIAPLPPNPQPPAQPQPSPQDDAAAQNLGVYDARVMGTDGQMRDVSQMNDAELEAARQMHVGLGNSREVQVIAFEQQRRSNSTQTGPQGYA